MKWLILPLFLLSSAVQAQSLTEYQCNKGISTSNTTSSTPCYLQAMGEVSQFILENGNPKWPHAVCYAISEKVAANPKNIEKAKASFKKNVGTFQNHEIQFNNFYMSTQPEIETGQKLRSDYGIDFEKRVVNSKYVVKVQTASVKTADGAVHCKTHLAFVNN